MALSYNMSSFKFSPNRVSIDLGSSRIRQEFELIFSKLMYKSSLTNIIYNEYEILWTATLANLNFHFLIDHENGLQQVLETTGDNFCVERIFRIRGIPSNFFV